MSAESSLKNSMQVSTESAKESSIENVSIVNNTSENNNENVDSQNENTEDIESKNNPIKFFAFPALAVTNSRISLNSLIENKIWRYITIFRSYSEKPDYLGSIICALVSAVIDENKIYINQHFSHIFDKYMLPAYDYAYSKMLQVWAENPNQIYRYNSKGIDYNYQFKLWIPEVCIENMNEKEQETIEYYLGQLDKIHGGNYAKFDSQNKRIINDQKELKVILAENNEYREMYQHCCGIIMKLVGFILFRMMKNPLSKATIETKTHDEKDAIHLIANRIDENEKVVTRKNAAGNDIPDNRNIYLCRLLGKEWTVQGLFAKVIITDIKQQNRKPMQNNRNNNQQQRTYNKSGNNRSYNKPGMSNTNGQRTYNKPGNTNKASEQGKFVPRRQMNQNNNVFMKAVAQTNPSGTHSNTGNTFAFNNQNKASEQGKFVPRRQMNQNNNNSTRFERNNQNRTQVSMNNKV